MCQKSVFSEYNSNILELRMMLTLGLRLELRNSDPPTDARNLECIDARNTECTYARNIERLEFRNHELRTPAGTPESRNHELRSSRTPAGTPESRNHELRSSRTPAGTPESRNHELRSSRTPARTPEFVHEPIHNMLYLEVHHERYCGWKKRLHA